MRERDMQHHAYVTIYRMTAGRYGQPAVLGLEGQTAMTAVPGVSIDWDRLPVT